MKTSHSHPHRRKLKRYLAALLFPLLLLTACDMNSYIKLNEDNTADIQTEMKLSKSELEMLSLGGEAPSCDELMDESLMTEGPEYTVTDLSADGNLHCKAEAKGQSLEAARNNDQDSITNEDGIYTVDVKGDDTIDLSMLGLTGSAFNISMTYEFPGSVIEASAGEIDGNKVTITDIAVAKEGLHIKAYSTEKMVLAPWAMWLIIGAAILLVAGLIFWLVRRNKNKGQKPHGTAQQSWSPQTGQQGGPQPQGYQQPGQAQPHAPQHGQPQWQPPQGQPPYGQPQHGQQQHGQPQWQPPQHQPGQQPPQAGQYPTPPQQPQPPRQGEQPPSTESGSGTDADSHDK